MNARVQGPESYFPSIEKTYGKPLDHWPAIARDGLKSQPHMSVVALLKSDHGLGHGHANAIVAHAKAHKE